MKALGIDLGGTKIEARLLDAQGRELWRERRATPQGDYGATVAALVAQVQAARQWLRAQPDASAAEPFTVGVGTPGSVDARGRMKNCNSTCLNGQPLPDELRARLGQPVAVANDANCLALSEATDGAAAGAPVVFAAILGTGVGAGIVVHGRLLLGLHGLAGEWGHNPLPWSGPGQGQGQEDGSGFEAHKADFDAEASAQTSAQPDPAWRCYCGRLGCIETLLSGPGLAREHRARHGGPALSAADIAEAAARGNTAAAATLQRHRLRLARALACVVNLLDPDVIVLGGGLSLLPELPEQLPPLMRPWIFSTNPAEPLLTRIVRAQHGDASGVRGAAWLGRAQAVG